jgi:hypothetical protein
MKNSKNQKTVELPGLDRELLNVTEETILRFMARKGQDFRKCDGWADTVVHLSIASVRYIAVKKGKFLYFKELPIGDFDLIINVGFEAAELPDDELDASLTDFGAIRAVTGPAWRRANAGQLAVSGLKSNAV